MGQARRSIAAVAAAALLAGACGQGPDAQADPKGALQAAIDSMAEWEGSTVTLRLDVAEEDLPLLVEGMEHEDEEALRQVTASTATFSAYAGEDLEDTSDDVMTMAVVIDGIDAFDLRVIQGDIYVRSDVRALIAEFEPELDVDAEIAKAATAAETFGIDFLEEAADGGWLKLTGAEQMAAMLEGMGAVPVPDTMEPTELASEVQAATQQLLDRLAVSHVGSDDTGEHLQATVTGGELFDAFAPLLESSFGQMWEQFGAGTSFLDDLRSEPEFQEFAATTIPFELWLDGGELRQVGFDVIQLFRMNPDLLESPEDEAEVEEIDHVLVAAGLERFTGEVETPADAIEVSLFELVGKAMGAFGGMGGGATAWESAPAAEA